MTEQEANRILDEIRTPASFFAQGRRPYVRIGRYRYEVNALGHVLTFTAVGKSGLRWRLEPFEDRAVDHHLAAVRAIGRDIEEGKATC